MFHDDVFMDAAGLYYQVELWLDQADQDEAKHLALHIGSSAHPIALPPDAFEAALPDIIYPSELSARGEVSRRRVAGKIRMSHRERLAMALLERFEAMPPTDRVEFWTAGERDGMAFHFDEQKFTKYLLNVDHPTGGGKAKFFVENLGIEPHDWRYLASQIEQGMETASIYRAGKNQWGFTHGAFVLVTGRNGKTSVIETGWIVEPQGATKLVTAYPGDKDLASGLVPPSPMVVQSDLSGDDRWVAIFEKAKNAGVL